MDAEALSDIRRKMKILNHAEQSGNISHTCRYYGMSRETLYRWKRLYKANGEAGLINSKFLLFKNKQGQKLKRFQYTVIDDATRIRALKIYTRHTQQNAIDFINDVVNKFPFQIHTVQTDNGHE